MKGSILNHRYTYMCVYIYVYEVSFANQLRLSRWHIYTYVYRLVCVYVCVYICM